MFNFLIIVKCVSKGEIGGKTIFSSFVHFLTQNPFIRTHSISLFKLKVFEMSLFKLKNLKMILDLLWIGSKLLSWKTFLPSKSEHKIYGNSYLNFHQINTKAEKLFSSTWNENKKLFIQCFIKIELNFSSAKKRFFLIGLTVITGKIETIFFWQGNCSDFPQHYGNEWIFLHSFIYFFLVFWFDINF